MRRTRKGAPPAETVPVNASASLARSGALKAEGQTSVVGSVALSGTSALDARGRVQSTGVVTFLDILGWQGVWQREDDPLAALERLVNLIVATLQEEAKGTNITVRHDAVKSISDTVAIFTEAGDDLVNSVLDLHGRVCAVAIPRSIELKIPLRGATSVGQYELSQNRFVGKAVDEAAAWYETVDWIGVHMTPSAWLAFDPGNRTSEGVWIVYQPPRLQWVTHCVRWGMEPQVIRALFRQMGPIVPEIAGKYMNTIRFLEEAVRS